VVRCGIEFRNERGEAESLHIPQAIISRFFSAKTKPTRSTEAHIFANKFTPNNHSLQSTYC